MEYMEIKMQDQIEGAQRSYEDLHEEILMLRAVLRQIGDYAHDNSTGPAVPDALWDIRAIAYANA